MAVSRRPFLKFTGAALAAGGALITTRGASASVLRSGEPAPDFTGTLSNGETLRLADFRGQRVVLEWTNRGCPYVIKHYTGGNMQRLQADAAANGEVWIQVISSAPGRQGYVTGLEAEAEMDNQGGQPAHIVLDPEGAIGRLYGATNTPHMYVIDAEGVLAYQGGIDDRPTANPADVAGATNYVTAALADLRANRAVATPVGRPYGCSVKYGNTSA